MRLLIVGTLKGQLTTATKIAMDRGASVTHAESIEQALAVLRSGKGADLLMVEVAVDIRDLVTKLELEHIYVPIVACGIENDARAAVAAIHAGAKEYIPLPPDPDLIAAVLAAVADDTRELVWRDEAMAHGLRNVRLRRLGADHRRVRHRQGGSGALRAHPFQPRQEAVHLRELRGGSGTCWNPNCSATKGLVHRRSRASRLDRGSHRRTLLLDEIRKWTRLQAKPCAPSRSASRSRRRHPPGAGRYPHHRHV
jgi:DNA-binding response OmpR family regulator